MTAHLGSGGIDTLYQAAGDGIGESGGRKFLVTALDPGETLAERINRGALPLEESLGIATPIQTRRKRGTCPAPQIFHGFADCENPCED